MSNRTTFFTIESDAPIKAGNLESLIARTQIEIRPHRLRIDPMIAPFFLIHEVKVGNRSMLPRGGQSIPAAQFMHGAGDGFDLGLVLASQDVVMTIENVSHKIPGIRGGSPLPFKATWACIITPTLTRDGMIILRDAREIELELNGREDIGSRIDRVPETVGRPQTKKIRTPPGFGWDPEGD